MVDGDGRPAGRIGVTVDISERVASERALRTARNYLRAVADSMGEGLFTLDTDGPRHLHERGRRGAARLDGRAAAGPRDARGRALPPPRRIATSPIEDCPILRARRRPARRCASTTTCSSAATAASSRSPTPPRRSRPTTACRARVVVFNDISERKASEEALRRESDELAWIGRIRDALADDRFVLYAQPIVDLVTRRRRPERAAAAHARPRRRARRAGRVPRRSPSSTG